MPGAKLRVALDAPRARVRRTVIQVLDEQAAGVVSNLFSTVHADEPRRCFCVVVLDADRGAPTSTEPFHASTKPFYFH